MVSDNPHIKRNNLIYNYFVRHELEKCKILIETSLKADARFHEYPLFVKGIILRQEGRLPESLDCLKGAARLNAKNVVCLQQVARSFMLLGRFSTALKMYSTIERLDSEDAEVWHNKGMCFFYLRQYDNAIDALRNALSISPQEKAYLLLAKIHLLQKNIASARETYLDGLEIAPDSSDLLTALAQCQMDSGDLEGASISMKKALEYSSSKSSVYLTYCALLQKKGKNDNALDFYRNVAELIPNSARMWSNIGMCFYEKDKVIAAIACLKRALYLDPFQHGVFLNLGIVHAHNRQYASAFNYLTAAINLEPDNVEAYGTLCVVLSELGDVANARSSYEKVLGFSKFDVVTFLNYGVFLSNQGQADQVRALLKRFEFKLREVLPLSDELMGKLDYLRSI